MLLYQSGFLPEPRAKVIIIFGNLDSKEKKMKKKGKFTPRNLP